MTRNEWNVVSIVCIGAVLVVIFAAVLSPSNPGPQASAAPVTAATVPAPEEPKLTPAQRERAMQQLRIAYGKVFDDKMIDVGLESRSAAVGPRSTTLRIEYALAGRVSAKQLADALDFDTMSKLGFKKVYFTNGFDGELHFGMTWTVD